MYLNMMLGVKNPWIFQVLGPLVIGILGMPLKVKMGGNQYQIVLLMKMQENGNQLPI